ncbi:hypothetical protein IW18_01155 [Flavobacterium hibernum]|uniref:Uncharacterized protein n=1 Tax=Flavobacterium hibernum TaxID=37752 RepID=A0A0D0F9F2_9FLAO|nr:hypothetical protein IW18_01155 [Flavobacterium hibernum]
MHEAFFQKSLERPVDGHLVGLMEIFLDIGQRQSLTQRLHVLIDQDTHRGQAYVLAVKGFFRCFLHIIFTLKINRQQGLSAGQLQ